MHTWDLRTQRCVGRAVDEGCVRGTALACSADMFATGSDSGVVNVHRRDAAATGVRKLVGSVVEPEPAHAEHAEPCYDPWSR